MTQSGRFVVSPPSLAIHSMRWLLHGSPAEICPLHQTTIFSTVSWQDKRTGHGSWLLPWDSRPRCLLLYPHDPRMFQFLFVTLMRPLKWTFLLNKTIYLQTPSCLHLQSWTSNHLWQFNFSRYRAWTFHVWKYLLKPVVVSHLKETQGVG